MSTTSLRFLADESCDFSIVRALRGKGFHGLASPTFQRGKPFFGFYLTCDHGRDLEDRTDHGTKMPTTVQRNSFVEGI